MWKRVKSKSERFLGANSYVCKSYRGKNGWESTFNPKNKYATVELCLSSLEEKILKLDIPKAVMPYIVLKTTKLLR